MKIVFHTLTEFSGIKLAKVFFFAQLTRYTSNERAFNIMIELLKSKDGTSQQQETQKILQKKLKSACKEKTFLNYIKFNILYSDYFFSFGKMRH